LFPTDSISGQPLETTAQYLASSSKDRVIRVWRIVPEPSSAASAMTSSPSELSFQPHDDHTQHDDDGDDGDDDDGGDDEDAGSRTSNSSSFSSSASSSSSSSSSSVTNTTGLFRQLHLPKKKVGQLSDQQKQRVWFTVAWAPEQRQQPRQYPENMVLYSSGYNGAWSKSESVMKSNISDFESHEYLFFRASFEMFQAIFWNGMSIKSAF
jgi:hypothetical protein